MEEHRILYYALRTHVPAWNQFALKIGGGRFAQSLFHFLQTWQSHKLSQLDIYEAEWAT
jgi:hypothetical protein